MLLNWTQGPLRDEAGDELNLDPGQVGNPADPGGTPPASEPPAQPPTPAFALEIDERTKYDDPAKARDGFLNLKGDRDKHKTDAERLAEENRRLKIALGGDPAGDKTKSSLTPEQLEQQRRWLKAVKPELNLLTIEDLQRPEVQAALDEIADRREQQRLVFQGQAHITKVLAKHEITLSATRRKALEDYLGNIIGNEDDEDSVQLQRRFASGDMTVLDELIEEHFAAHIQSRAAAADKTAEEEQRQRDQRGRFAKTLETKEKVAKLTTAPPKGGVPPAQPAQPATPKLDTPEKRKKRMDELLQQIA